MDPVEDDGDLSPARFLDAHQARGASLDGTFGVRQKKHPDKGDRKGISTDEGMQPLL